MMNIWHSTSSTDGSDTTSTSSDEEYKEFGPVLSEQEKVSPYWQGLRWGKSSSSSPSSTTATTSAPRRRLNSSDSSSVDTSSIGEEEEEYKEFGPVLSIQEQAIQQQHRRRPLRRMLAQTRTSMTGWEVTNWMENRRRTQEICHEKDIEYTIQTQRCNLMMLDVQ